MSFGKETRWTEEAGRRLAKQLKGFIPADVFHSGLQLFVGGHDAKSHWANSTRFVTESGSSPASLKKTSADFGFLPFSRCWCGSKGSCPHLAAAICAALISREVPLLDYVREYDLATIGEAELSAMANLLGAGARQASAALEAPVKRASGRAPHTSSPPASASPSPRLVKQAVESAPEAELPAPWDGYRKWHRLFNLRMPRYTHAAAPFVHWIEHQLLRSSHHWADEDAKALYRVHALLYAFRLGDRSFARGGLDYQKIEVAEALMKEFVRALDEWTSRLPGLSEEASAGATGGVLAILGEYSFAEAYTFADWLHIYRSVWARLHLPPETLRQERRRLELLLRESPELHPALAAIAEAGIVHMHELEHGPARATAHVREHWQRSPAYFYPYLEAYRQMENWTALKLWLYALRDLAADNGDENDVEALLHYWEPLANATLPRGRRAEELGRFLEALLPDGFQAYAAVLLELKDYRAWVDLHLAYRVLPEHTAGAEIVERKAPELLLPVYHLFAEEWIGERKRDGYRQAILHLKKLRTLYSATGKRSRWEDYIARLADRYSRLKALQEELREERLLPG